MLVRDFLVALPGLVSPLSTARATETTSFTSQPAQVITAQTGFDIFGLNRTDTSTSTLLDFYNANNISIESPSIAHLIADNGDGGDNGGDGGGDNGGTSDGSPDDPTDGPDTGEPGDPVDGGDNPGPIDFGDLPLGTEQVMAEAGRVTHIAPSANTAIADVTILEQASHGHVSVNPDNSIALVLSEDHSNVDPVSFTYEVTYLDGSTETVTTAVDVTPSQQAAGWGLGEFYMLEEDSDGTLVIEHGENHRKIHVTKGEHGLTAEDIARAEGLGAADITADWLRNHPEYGSSPDMALDSELGLELWYATTQPKAGPTSNWLLFERGYDYGDAGRLIYPGANGESELHPMLVGAYGEGSDPVISSLINIYQRVSNHVVIRDLDVHGMKALDGHNILLDNMSLTGASLNIQTVENFTFRNSDIVDIVNDEPNPQADYWHPSLNRTGGAYLAENTGVLFEGNFLDHNGWAEGYDYNLSAEYPQPPSYYSQNIYITDNNRDLTLRDNIVMRGASFGAQVRSGGVIEDNIFLDNNAGVSFLGGNYKGAGYVGNYSLFLDNLVTSAGHKRVAEKEGALSIGVIDEATQSSLIGNIVAHLADPNNPTEIAEKYVVHDAMAEGLNTYFDDTIIYNWATNEKGELRNPDTNIDGLDMAVLDQTTIQNFTAQLLGKETATINDLGNYLRAQAAGQLDDVVDADLINAYFREGFGLSTTLRAEETTLRFSPDDRGEGMRWDNRLNWSTTDLPGTQDGDSVDLGGNRVLFGAKTVTVDDFIFGDYGQLKATSGRLDITGEISVAETGALLQVDNAGQVWVAGYHDDDLFQIDLQGGRFANTGSFAGPVAMTVGDNAQALLATAGGSFDLRQGSSLTIEGTGTRTGFDGASGGTALLRLHDGATINMIAGADGLGQIREFYSGAFGEQSSVTSGVRLDGTLSIDLSNWTASDAAQQWTVLDADQLIGQFDEFKLTGLASDRDVLLRVNYVSDDVTLVISEAGAGTGRVRMSESGDADFINYTTDEALKSLWDELHQAAPQLSDLPL
ncbi:right-handed parallel beta-helix repeat-containing protein [Paracoccus homiensis]|uniref:right-handed parallel beta-helix repeat-containing protein n=1 Tax=Paracoccus homiensis TaxID=364199 RepID=UPI00398D52DD